MPADPYVNFVIQRDTREQKGVVYEFNAQYELPKALTVDQVMKTGDYGLWSPEACRESGAVVERKTLPDLLASIADGRLKEQAERLFENFEYPAIVIEASWATIIDGNCKGGGYKLGNHYSKMKPQAVAGFLIKLQMEKGITVMPAVNSTGAEYWTYKWLRRAYKILSLKYPE